MNETALFGDPEALQQQCEELLKNPVVLLLLALAAVSEAMPFLKKYRCNGVSHFIVTFVVAFVTAARSASEPSPVAESRRVSVTDCVQTGPVNEEDIHPVSHARADVKSVEEEWKKIDQPGAAQTTS